MKAKKRFFSLLMAICLLVGLLPTSALAASSTSQTENSVAKVGNVYYDDLAEALNNAGNQTCDILKDTSLSGRYEFTSWNNNPVTINLNGHTIMMRFRNECFENKR